MPTTNNITLSNWCFMPCGLSPRRSIPTQRPSKHLESARLQNHRQSADFTTTLRSPTEQAPAAPHGQITHRRTRSGAVPLRINTAIPENNSESQRDYNIALAAFEAAISLMEQREKLPYFKEACESVEGFDYKLEQLLSGFKEIQNIFNRPDFFKSQSPRSNPITPVESPLENFQKNPLARDKAFSPLEDILEDFKAVSTVLNKKQPSNILRIINCVIAVGLTISAFIFTATLPLAILSVTYCIAFEFYAHQIEKRSKILHTLEGYLTTLNENPLIKANRSIVGGTHVICPPNMMTAVL